MKLTKHLYYIVLTVVIIAIGFSACKPENENPFDNPALQPPPADSTANLIPQDNFAWLHQKVFKPTCANSGCHDGTFEPDYRTISSAYNSMVYQPIIKNNPANTFTYRVVPFNADASVLVNRLTVDIDGQSGIMPLIVDQSSDWPSKKTEYIEAIKAWINGGAKDMFGNLPQIGNKKPEVLGLQAFIGGTSTPLALDDLNRLIIPPGTASIDFKIAVADDSTAAANIGYNKFKLSPTFNGFATALEQGLTTIPNQAAPGFGGQTVQYNRQGTVNLSSYAPGTSLFLRVYISDGSQPDPSEIPNAGSSQDFVNFFILLRN